MRSRVLIAAASLCLIRPVGCLDGVVSAVGRFFVRFLLFWTVWLREGRVWLPFCCVSVFCGVCFWRIVAICGVCAACAGSAALCCRGVFVVAYLGVRGSEGRFAGAVRYSFASRLPPPDRDAVIFCGAFGGFCDLAWRVLRMLRAASVAVLQMIFLVCARFFGADSDSGRRVAAR